MVRTRFVPLGPDVFAVFRPRDETLRDSFVREDLLEIFVIDISQTEIMADVGNV